MTSTIRDVRLAFTVALAAAATVLLIAGTSNAWAAPQTVAGKITRVTLYRGEAMVVRTIELGTGAGSEQIVVSDLPEHVVPESLFAEGAEQLEIRAVRFRTRAVGAEPREEVRKLDEAIAAVSDNIAANKKMQELLTKRAAYLDRMETFSTTTAATDLSKGVLNAESLERITTFAFAQRREIATEQLTSEREARKLQEELGLLQRKRSELTAGSSRTVREAVIFVENRGGAKVPLRLNYLVRHCGWSPSFTLRATGDQQPVRVEFSALVQQMTGEDWSDVELSLSTASPALSAASPGLGPFYVSLAAPAQQAAGAPAPAAVEQQYRSLLQKQEVANFGNRNALNLRDNIGTSWVVNSAANDIQALELSVGKSTLTRIASENAGAAAPSLTYNIAGSVSLASRSDQQVVRILQDELKSRFYHVATPVLGSSVYREAELSNGGKHDLLGGPVTVYLDGQFVGRTEIPTVARGERFLVGFGADPQLRVRRELADKVDDVQGGNRELTFRYRLVIENFKDRAVPVRIFDRLPFSQQTSDVRVTLGKMSDELSGDKVYQRTERPKGLLRWEIEVPASASGENARMIDYEYTVEFDRNFNLTSATAVPQLQMEFEKLQRSRLKR